MRGRAAETADGALGEDDRRPRDMLGRAVAQARGSADYSGAGRAGHRRDQPPGGPHPHTRHARPRRREVRTARPTEATGHRAPHVRPDPRPTAATGRRSPRPARDMSGPLSSGVPGEMPQAAQTAGRSRVMRLFSRATDRAGCRERRESDEKREAPERTKRVWPEHEENPAGRQREVRERLAPNRSHLRTARACQTAEAMRDACGRATAAEARPMPGGVPGWTARPDVPDMRGVARTVREDREGIPGYLGSRPADAYLEDANSLTRPVKRAARGFRNVECLTTAIFPGLGGLSFGALACAQS